MRQSTLRQVLSNQESLQLQYDLKKRAEELGWHKDQITIIDNDLGISGKTSDARDGFKSILADVTLEKVGIILSYDVTRLSRNCSDWYPLLDVCSYKSCLIGDRDGIYDPSTINGRMLLGLKGQMSEMELYTIQNRLTAGKRNKASRGDLSVKLPVGFARDAGKNVCKDSNIDVQKTIELIFTIFLKVHSATKVVQYFHDQHLKMPRKDYGGEIIWRRPDVKSILLVLRNPAYAGAFVYGKSTKLSNGTIKFRPREEWDIVIKDKYPSYIDWDTFEKINAKIDNNKLEYRIRETSGVPRQGASLLHGIVYCGKCGHKMRVQYQQGAQYLCDYLRMRYQEKKICQRVYSSRIDQYVVECFFKALSPAEIDLYSKVIELNMKNSNQVKIAQDKQLERLKYEAKIAEKNFYNVDSDNRLVAAELEKRWQISLLRLKEAEEKFEIERNSKNTLSLVSRKVKQSLEDIGKNLPPIWEHNIPVEKKKALLRSLIDRVNLARNQKDKVKIRIVWRGGSVTEAEIPVRVYSFADMPSYKEMEEIVLKYAREGVSDEKIAGILTDRGFRTPQNPDAVPKGSVVSIRLKHKILKEAKSHPIYYDGFLTIPQITRKMNLGTFWIHSRIKSGAIRVKKNEKLGVYLFPDKEEIYTLIQKLKGKKIRRIIVVGEGYQYE